MEQQLSEKVKEKEEGRASQPFSRTFGHYSASLSRPALRVVLLYASGGGLGRVLAFDSSAQFEVKNGREIAPRWRIREIALGMPRVTDPRENFASITSRRMWLVNDLN
ncbi:hypothetical protein R1flu_024070 [Riccia fluitans]|uniref:Uncharacterized protein n=1 Tax=Riccia fluitans TaxID=41844 RepID=A0ABD1XUP7_9MARC